jgi:ABC-type sugar transport system substrate-binding protein
MADPDKSAPNEPSRQSLVFELVAILVGAVLLSLVPAMQPFHVDLVGGAILLVLARLAAAIPWHRLDTERRTVLKVVGVSLFVVGAVIGYATAFYSPHQVKRLLFISPVAYLSDQPFYSELADELIRQGKGSGYEVTIWLPAGDFSPQEQHALLARAAAEKDQYTTVVFTPFIVTDAGAEEQKYFEFLQQMKDRGIIIFDMDLSNELQERMSGAGMSVPPCVKGDEAAGGKMAANWLLNFLAAKGVKQPVIAAFDKPGHMGRSTAFQQRASEQLGQAATLLTWQTEVFGRQEAREVAFAALSQPQRVNAVFATNDVSALGVRDAILELQSEGKLSPKEPVWVMGYDGTYEVMQLLQRSEETILVNSVYVGIPDQVSDIIALANLLQTNRPAVLRAANSAPCKMPQPHMLRQ